MLALAACGSGGPAYEEPSPETAAIVEITPELTFSPAEITIRVGEKVEWRNLSGRLQTVTADPRLADPANITLPEGAEPFNSAVIPAAQIFRHTFDVPGTYRYVSLPHERAGMFGTVIVAPEP